MNEVTKIHLGRQPFVISIDAHHELRSYLDAIKKQVRDTDVIEEIELRMAELLTEHGVHANKVVLASDIAFLKVQLGNPKDFTDENEATTLSGLKQSETKRLYRDTDNAMVAGVASGLAEYFGIDVLLVRVLFVIAVLATVGWGILLYVVLWLLVPEAKTSSDRLRMAGKPVTIDSLKEIVEQADIKSAAHRATSSLAGPINTLFRFLLKFIGLVFVVSGLSVIFGLIAAVTYLTVNYHTWTQYNIFPVGFRENLLLYLAVAVITLIAVFIILFGTAMFRRKWPLHTWVTGTLVGLVFIGLAVGGALAADVYPNVRDRYNANVHTSIRTTAPFTGISVNGPVNISFQTSSTYSVGLTYFDRPDLTSVKTNVQKSTLVIDTSQFDWNRNCKTLCLPDKYDLEITIYSPNASQLSDQFDAATPLPPKPPVPIPQPKIDMGN